MYSKAKRDELLTQYGEAVEANVTANLSADAFAPYLKDGDAETVRRLVGKIQKNMISAFQKVLGKEPKAIITTSCIGDGSEGISVVVISMKSSYTADDADKFKFSARIAAKGEILRAVVDHMKAWYEQLLLKAIMDVNLYTVNALLSDLCADAQVPYKISLVAPMNYPGKKIAKIVDDEIVFVADEDRLFDTEDILVLQAEVDGEVITEEKVEAAREPLIDEIGACQTTPQAAKIFGGSLVKYLCGVSNQVKAMTAIRKAYNRNVRHLTGNTDTFAYFDEKGVYAVVVRKDGNFEVALSPFNTKTFENVDVDVLSDIADPAE